MQKSFLVRGWWFKIKIGSSGDIYLVDHIVSHAVYTSFNGGMVLSRSSIAPLAYPASLRHFLLDSLHSFYCFLL